MAASSNFGNVFSVLVASVWLPFLPMLAIHLLIQNLLYDISQIGIPFDRPVVGYGGRTINTLRLWAAAAPDFFDFQAFSHGDFAGAQAGTLAAGRG